MVSRTRSSSGCWTIPALDVVGREMKHLDVGIVPITLMKTWHSSSSRRRVGSQRDPSDYGGDDERNICHHACGGLSPPHRTDRQSISSHLGKNRSCTFYYSQIAGRIRGIRPLRSPRCAQYRGVSPSKTSATATVPHSSVAAIICPS